MSGSGMVSKEVTDEQLLDSWRDVLHKWQQNVKQRPKQVLLLGNGTPVMSSRDCIRGIVLSQVKSLVRKGVPEALRGEVWQLLAGCTDNAEMLENYRVLITKVSQTSACKTIVRICLS